MTQKWEYKVHKVLPNLIKSNLDAVQVEMNVLGESGWEAVNFTRTSEGLVIILLKRPKI